MIQSTLVNEPGTVEETTEDTPLLEEQEDQVEPQGDNTSKYTPEQVAADKEHRMLEDLRHYRSDLQKQAEEVSRRESVYESLKSQAAMAKKSWEASQKSLHEMVLQEVTLPLFNQPDDEDVFADTAASTAEENDAWREATLSDLGITGKLAELLTDSELDTLGKISDYTSAGKQLTDIKGIGPEKGDFIADACSNHFATHPVATKQPDDEQTTDTDDESGDDDTDEQE